MVERERVVVVGNLGGVRSEFTTNSKCVVALVVSLQARSEQSACSDLSRGFKIEAGDVIMIRKIFFLIGSDRPLAILHVQPFSISTVSK